MKYIYSFWVLIVITVSCNSENQLDLNETDNLLQLGGGEFEVPTNYRIEYLLNDPGAGYLRNNEGDSIWFSEGGMYPDKRMLMYDEIISIDTIENYTFTICRLNEQKIVILLFWNFKDQATLFGDTSYYGASLTARYDDSMHEFKAIYLYRSFICNGRFPPKQP